MEKSKGFYPLKNVLLIGATGGIGRALSHLLLREESVSQLLLFSRCQNCRDMDPHSENISYGYVDFSQPDSICQMGKSLDQPLDLVIIASGWLHGNGYMPEKRLQDITEENLQYSMQVNAIGPILVARALIPKLRKGFKTVFVVLSARVSSISDNRLGGWYAYRASKAALNMYLKTLAIELGRTHPDAIVAGLHPGTVDTSLSQPFQGRVPAGKLFSSEQSAGYLLSVIDALAVKDSGKLFAWDGAEILP